MGLTFKNNLHSEVGIWQMPLSLDEPNALNALHRRHGQAEAKVSTTGGRTTLGGRVDDVVDMKNDCAARASDG
ncbi:hypothetical protein [Microvirga ossetica]|uniref:hypothetical protein n=1 Tax=Microvirga ossetica TaxID=1882682 RepID=UPI0012FFDE78|nr:hypothetical protein [Microvirga ossetica]